MCRRYHHILNDIVRSLEFAPAVSMFSDKIIHEMFVRGHWPFNGVHVRLERDGISAWASGAGEPEVRLHLDIAWVSSIG